MREDWKTINLLYDKVDNSIVFPIHSSKILPTFLHYLLEYHKLPQNATLIFPDQVVRLVKDKNEFKYEEVYNEERQK